MLIFIYCETNIFENIGNQRASSIFTAVIGNRRRSSVWMLIENMTPFLACHFKAEFSQQAIHCLEVDELESTHMLTSIC